MITVAIVNQKGGVGKTTTAITLGHGLAMRGYKTLIVDLDAQGNVSDALGLKKHGGLHELLFRDPRSAVSRRALKKRRPVQLTWETLRRLRRERSAERLRRIAWTQ